MSSPSERHEHFIICSKKGSYSFLLMLQFPFHIALCRHPLDVLSCSSSAILDSDATKPNMYPLQSPPRYFEVKHRVVQKTQHTQQLMMKWTYLVSFVSFEPIHFHSIPSLS